MLNSVLETRRAGGHKASTKNDRVTRQRPRKWTFEMILNEAVWWGCHEAVSPYPTQREETCRLRVRQGLYCHILFCSPGPPATSSVASSFIGDGQGGIECPIFSLIANWPRTITGTQNYCSISCHVTCYTLHILFIWQVVHGALNRKLRVHFGCLGRFLEILDPKTHPFRPCYRSQ